MSSPKITFIQFDDSDRGYRPIAEMAIYSKEWIYVGRCDANQALYTVKFPPDPKVQRLISAIRALDIDELLKDLNGEIALARRCAAEVIGLHCQPRGQLAEQKGRAITALRKQLHDPIPSVRSAVADALIKLDAVDDEVAVVVGRLLQAEDKHVRSHCAYTVTLLGMHLKAALCDLINGLDSKDDNVRTGCAKALSLLGPEAAPAVPALMKALDDLKWYVVRETAEALGNIGAEAKCAIPALERVAEGGTYFHNEAASEAIRKIRAVDK
jgi:HEAT repeat protein